MKVDPQVLRLLQTIGNRMSQLEHPPLDQLTPKQSRDYYEVAREYFKELPVDGVNVDDSSFMGRAGNEIPVRIYTPEGEGPFPVLVYFHGGGWVFGNIDSSNNICRYFSCHAKTVIVSVDYRLAPEHKYPAAFHDALDAITWVSNEAGHWNTDSHRLAVGGESSGGNLAAASAIYFMDKPGIEISHQFLITPVLDYNFDTESYRSNYTYNLTNEKMKWFFQHYLNREEEGRDVFVSPLRLKKMAGLPPTIMVTAEYDPLREEAFAYAEELHASGVTVTHHHFDDLVHSFINMAGVVDRSAEALESITRTLKERLHR
ncbi:alpha/beta hydrolase fold domain-containing protein [Halobacillus litoralis]|uniref:Alpha/beta hydrolase fold domain-containing protein n=1 Tax=Halobacillus litoralis TaxID=45668 RepID=A0A845FA12_9BACI|nr:alpha/beta hydrolase [Halobacillus litoralis]MYL70495.1 alpha/beta hydrolase fold domain-containing protein [Halobacillus litoralis]